jgi:hypothetical protein
MMMTVERGLVARVEALLDLANPHQTLARLLNDRQDRATDIDTGILRAHLSASGIVAHPRATQLIEHASKLDSTIAALRQLDVYMEALAHSQGHSRPSLLRNISSWQLRLAHAARQQLLQSLRLFSTCNGECARLILETPRDGERFEIVCSFANTHQHSGVSTRRERTLSWSCLRSIDLSLSFLSKVNAQMHYEDCAGG